MKLPNLFKWVKHEKPSVAFSSYGFGYRTDPYPELQVLVEYYKRSPLFKLTVDSRTSFSVGFGSYCTVENADKTQAKKNLELIEKLHYEADLEDIYQNITRDMWISGNCFILVEPKKLEVSIIPQSSIRWIIQNEDGTPAHYTQILANGSKDILPDEMIHYKRNHLEGEPFGEGIGQVAARTGQGYKNHAGNKINRASILQLEEMILDVMARMFYSGQPRWLIQSDLPQEETATLVKEMDKVEPLQHFFATAKNFSVHTLGLQSESKFNDFLAYAMQQFVITYQNPLIKLWAEKSFNYASAFEAIKVLLPMIEVYQRSFKRFIEKNIFRPIIVEHFGQSAWDKHPVSINWGSEEHIDLRDINTFMSIVTKIPNALDYLEAQKMLEYIMQQIGIDIELTKPKPEEQPSMQQSLQKARTPKEPSTDELMHDTLKKMADKI